MNSKVRLKFQLKETENLGLFMLVLHLQIKSLVNLHIRSM
jgi:hypothetical protein